MCHFTATAFGDPGISTYTDAAVQCKSIRNATALQQCISSGTSAVQWCISSAVVPQQCISSASGFWTQQCISSTYVYMYIYIYMYGSATSAVHQQCIWILDSAVLQQYICIYIYIYFYIYIYIYI
jgi:hypothetical protein